MKLNRQQRDTFLAGGVIPLKLSYIDFLRYRKRLSNPNERVQSSNLGAGLKGEFHAGENVVKGKPAVYVFAQVTGKDALTGANRHEFYLALLRPPDRLTDWVKAALKTIADGLRQGEPTLAEGRN